MEERTILVVDDDPVATEYLRLVLEEQFRGVRIACGGADAWIAIRRQPPSLIVSDLRMPGMDGSCSPPWASCPESPSDGHCRG